MNSNTYPFSRLSKVYHCKATELQVSKIRGMKIMPIDHRFNILGRNANITERYLDPRDNEELLDEYESLFGDVKNSEEKLDTMLILHSILFGDVERTRLTPAYPVQTIFLRLNQQYTDGINVLSFWYMLDDDFGGEMISSKDSDSILDNMISGYNAYGENIKFILVAPRMEKCTPTIYNLVKNTKTKLKNIDISVVPLVSMLINPLGHSLSSGMRIIDNSEKDEVIRIMDSVGIEISKFPGIFSNSVDSKLLGAKKGDIIEIIDTGPMTNTIGTKRFRLVIDKISNKAPNQYGKMIES